MTDPKALQHLAKLAVSVIITIGFIACIFVLMFAKIELSSGAEKAFLILVGALAMSFGQVSNYWLGSSAGSATKSDQIAAMVANSNGTPR